MTMTTTRPSPSTPPAATTAAVPAIEVSDLTVAYRERPVLWDVDLTVPQGILMAVCGPNGAGKTTMMKAILGLLKPVAGEVQVLGASYEANRHLVGYVPQRGSVDWDFPTSVLDVVMMGRYGALGWFKRPGQKERRAAQEALGQVGMGDYAERQISQLSGGQQQRVFLARALVQDASVYLMDEPFQGVDATTERAIVELLRTLRAAGKTVVAVHHDLQTVGEYFDAVTLNVRKVASGPVAEAFTEHNLRLTFGGRVAFLSRDARPGDVQELAAVGEPAPSAGAVEPSPRGRGQGEGGATAVSGETDEGSLTPYADPSPRGEGRTPPEALPSPPTPLPVMGEASTRGAARG